MSLLPDLHLVERRPRLCRLGDDEVQTLAEHGPGVLKLEPTPRRRVWRVTPAGVVGVLHTPRRRVVISPKMPLANVLFLLDPSETSAPPLGIDTAPGEAAVRLLAGRLALLMRERAGCGLQRGYRERPHEGAVLQGRLDVAAQLRQPAGRRDRLHSRLDEFTADVPCNQVPRAVACLLLSSPALDAPARDALESAVAAFGEVSDVAPDGVLFDRLQRQPEPVGYGPLLDLCRVLAAGPVPAGSPAPALLLSLERLFERHLSRAVEEAFAENRSALVRCQAGYPVSDSLLLRPDVTVEVDGQPRLVVDAKWKRLPVQGHLPEDVYQALAYSAFLQAPRAVLIYPGRRRRQSVFTPPGFAGRVEVRTLNVSGLLERCRRSRARLIRELRRGL